MRIAGQVLGTDWLTARGASMTSEVMRYGTSSPPGRQTLQAR